MLPPGWHTKISKRENRPYYWHDEKPEPVWDPPSWEDEIAKNYNKNISADPSSQLFRSLQNFCKAALLEFFFLPFNFQRILDLGCGKGGDSAKFGSANVVGIDIAQDALKEARRRHPEKTFLKASFASAQKLCDQIEGKFDGFTSMFALQYGGANLERTLLSIKSVALPRARLMAIVLNDKFFEKKSAVFPLKVRIDGKIAWVQMDGTLDLPEHLLIDQDLCEACEKTGWEFQGSQPVPDILKRWGYESFVGPELFETRDALYELRKRFKGFESWDARHWEFAYQYKVIFLQLN